MAKHGWKGFGIHPHIAENRPHEVRTLGMNHPVEVTIVQPEETSSGLMRRQRR